MNQDQLKDFIEMLMWKLYGLNYRWGGDDTIEGFDCSGAILEILHSADLFPPRDARAVDIWRYFKDPQLARTVPFTSKIEFGDILFFGKTTDAISHIAMAYSSDVMFEFGGGGSTTTTIAVAAKQNAYGRFRPISRRNDLVAITRLIELS